MQNIKDRFPIGTVVTYHGYRLPVRVGQVARVIGYKDANGLYVIWAADHALGSVTPRAVKPQKEIGSPKPHAFYAEEATHDTGQRAGVLQTDWRGLMPPVMVLLTLALVVLLSGCATSEVKGLARQHDEHVYALWTLPGSPTEFLTRNCPARDGGEDWGAERDLDVPNRSDCVNVAGTRDAADSEFWKFELHRIKRWTYYWAIPLSPWYKSDDTKTVGIVGTQAQCESVRLRMDRKPRGVSGDDAMHMTKAPCEGPKYFRRPPLNAIGNVPRQPTTATSNRESALTPHQTTAASPPLILAPQPLLQPSRKPELIARATPTPPQPAPDPAQAWILGQWSSLAGMSGSVDGLAHFAFRREGSEIKWTMTRSGWFSGVQTTQKASGSVNKISESDLELVGKYDSSNLGNVAGQPVRHSFTRDGDILKGYELATDGNQSSLSLKRGR